jgi:hypothetical protein
MENLKRNDRVIISREEAELIRKEYLEGASINSLHKKFNHNRATIDKIVSGRHHTLRTQPSTHLTCTLNHLQSPSNTLHTP